MKNTYLILLSSLILSYNLCYSQTSRSVLNSKSSAGGGTGKNNTSQLKWTTNPFDHQVFIKNEGQFDGRIMSGDKILYAVQLGKVDLYFTQSKLVYCYDKITYIKDAETGTDPDEHKSITREKQFLSAEWKNANKSVSVEGKDEQNNYNMYLIGLGSTIKASLFRQIIYKNIYPGIDAVYQFIKGEDGIKYSIIVHPGADLSKVKIAYSGTKNISKNKQGDIIINSKIDVLTEHVPVTNYYGEKVNISFSNEVIGNTESFEANESYDKTKTIIIDPWVTDPLFSNTDKAYDLDWDYRGNVYAFGGNGGSHLQLVKMNSAGVIQWSYYSDTLTSGGCYGDFCTDKVTGTSYLAQGFSGGIVLKVNTLGNCVGKYAGNPYFDELWRAEYDACNGDVVIAGGGTGNVPNQAGVLDTNMTSLVPVNVLGVVLCYHDMAELTIDPNGKTCYIAAARSLGIDPNHDNNVVMQLPLPSLAPTAYLQPDYEAFIEVSSVHYTGGQANGLNGAAASPDWLYLYNGDTVRRFNKSNGNYISGFPVRTNTPFVYGGLDVDACNNLFIGVQDSLYIVDSSYNIKTKLLLPGTVYDIHLGEGNALYACGVGFVTQILNPYPPHLISTVAGSPSSCQACNGSATVNVNCGIEPYSFLWSNGSTNQTDTGLCAGLYTVRVTDGACPPHVDTAIVSISGKAGYAATVVDTNPGCQLNRGYIKVFPYGGASPYTYSWSNGATTQQISGLSAGIYVCTIIDNAGCKYEQDVNLINASPVTVNVVPVMDSICPGTPVSITASGTDKYSWTPHIGLSCYNCANPTATPLVSVTYTVIGSDTLGCENTATVTIKVLPAPTPVIKGRSPVCTSFSDTLIATGGISYTWSNGATTDTIIVVATDETLTVTATNGICSHDTTFTIVTDLPNAVITATYDSVCSKAPDTLTASGGDSYSWQPGGRTSPLIVVTPTITTTYTLSATDNQGGCVSTASVTIGIIKDIASTVHLSQDSICQGTPTSLDVVSSGNVVLSYTWSTGATTTVITVTPNADTTFYVIADGKCNKDSVAKKVNVIPLPIPVIAPLDSICKGSNDTLTVSGGTEYLWSNGSTKTTYIIKDIKADSNITVIAYNYRDKKCKVSETVNIPEKPLPLVTAKGATICAGECITIKATPSGGGYYTFSWSNGAMIDSTVVCPTTDTAYYVTVFNGCKSPRGVAEIQVFPQSLLVCCDTIIKEYASSNTTVGAGGKYQGNTAILTANKGKSYVWTPSSSLNCDTCQTVIATPTVTTTYTVNAIDSNGCIDVTTVTVKVEFPCFDFNVPNVFTPNGDNINDYFLVKTENLDGYSITIYDRWGKQVFNSSNPSQPWDGNTEGGSKAADGVYYWIITANCQGTNTKKDGFVQLIR